MKKLLVLVLAFLPLSAALAASPVEHKTNGGYILSMPDVTAASSKKVGLLIVLPGKKVEAKLERNNWAFAAARNNLALVAMEVDYEKVRQETEVDALHERIQAIIKEVQADEPTIETGPAFLGGSSRGGMATLAVALRHPGAYRAMGVACGALLAMGSEDVSANAKGQKFFFVHGSVDKVVPFEYFEKTLRRLSTDGAVLEVFVHKGAGHNLNTSDYTKVVRWMAAQRGSLSPEQ